MSDEPKRELLPGEAEADAWIDTIEQRADAMSDDIVGLMILASPILLVIIFRLTT